MKLFACMCNQPQRLPAALAPVRAALIAQPPVSRWGLGYIQGGDVLLVRTPKSSTTPIDLSAPLSELTSDCAIAQAVPEDKSGAAPAGTDNTPPFRFRRWMFAQTGLPKLDDIVPRLLEHVPEYLRRNIRGRTSAELIFHLFLAMLHDEGNIDDPNLATQAQRRALSATIRLVNAELERAGRATGDLASQLGNVALTNGRSMVLAQLTEPLRLRRLTVNDEHGRRDDSFRGVLLISGGDGDSKDGFEDVPARGAVLISRDLQVSFADLAP